MRGLSKNQIETIRRLRREGKSHRDIAKIFNLAKSTICCYTKGIKLSAKQHHFLMSRAIIRLRKTLPEEVFREACRKGGRNAPHKFQVRYTKEFLLNRIRIFYKENKRIPTKREFNSQWQCYLRNFGGWNKAIIAAGFDPNPEIFARKWEAKDGHLCDSLSEKIIDDFLSKNSISHERNVYYPKQKKFKTDFLINGKYWIEFVGLKGVLKRYDLLFRRKKVLAKKNGIKIVEICPQDLFPKERLTSCFTFLR